MKNNWFEIKALGEDTAEVWIYDFIGEDFFGDGISAKKFVAELSEITASKIDLHVNSPGGSVREGQAIHNAIVRHPAKVTTYVDGLAASIASTVALAGDEVIMADNSLMMIHSAWALSMGNAKDLRHAANVLEKHDQTIQGIYQRKSGKDIEDIQSAMAEETWFTAQEAVDFGLADKVEEGLQAAALAIDEQVMARYKNAPANLLDRKAPTEEAVVDTVVTSSTPDLSVVGAVTETDVGATSEEESKTEDIEFDLIRYRRS